MKSTKKIPGKNEISISDYQDPRVLTEMLKIQKPALFVLDDLLETTGISPIIVFNLIRSVNNIAIGSGYGKAIAEIENGICTFVRSEESSKVGEPVLVPKEKL